LPGWNAIVINAIWGNDQPADERVSSAEIRLLQYLCQADSDVAARRLVLDALTGYEFSTVHHQVLFDCLKAAPDAQAGLLASLLPARLVRAGFPDFDLEPYLRPGGLSAAEAYTLCTKLRAKL
jgi:hypothetical protein